VLEKECCLPGVFRDSGDMPANLLCDLNGHLVPYYYYDYFYSVCLQSDMKVFYGAIYPK